MADRIETNELSRRKLLALLGSGTAASVVLVSHPWFREALATSEPPGPTFPPPSIPATTPLQSGTPTVADLAASLDWDVDRIFRFVADDVRYDPYVGALRGATGTMWGLAGNAVDQAILLGALLGEAQVTWRFATGSLTDDAAVDLLAGAAFDVEAERQALGTAILRPDTFDAWSGNGAWTRDPEVDQLLAEARDRMDDSIRVIEEALAAAGIDVPETSLELPERERDEHVWIQYADGPKWIDLDPSIPGTEAGVSMVPAASTLDELPDDLFHTVTFRSTAEVITGGQPVLTELLSHQVRSADLAGVPIMLLHPSAEWLGIAEAITGNQQYVPTLIVGEQVVEGTVMTLSAGGGVLDALGDEETADGQALAAWLDVEVLVPGDTPKLSTRTLFDRLGTERRSAGTIDPAQLEPIELVEVEELGSVYLPLAGAITLTVAAAPTPWNYFADDPTTADDVSKLVRPAHAFQFLRDALRLDRLGELATRFYEDEPNVVAWWTGAALASESGKQGASVAVDVIHAHHVEVGTASGPRRAGVLAAALDHAAERIVLEGITALLPDRPDATFVSVGRVFELAADAGVDIVALSADDGDIPGASPYAQKLIREALDAGKVLVIPERAVDVDGVERIGWWEFDPATGHVLDRLDDGRGAELGEYMMMVHHMVSQVACLIALGVASWYIGGAIAGAVGTGSKAVAAGAVAFGQCALGFGGGGH